jgi:hypothetical protein
MHCMSICKQEIINIINGRLNQGVKEDNLNFHFLIGILLLFRYIYYFD